MKTKKKLVMVLSFLVCNLIFAQERDISFNFSNEIGSDLVVISEDNVVFPGIYNESIFEFSSEKIEAGIDVIFELITDEDGIPECVTYTDFDWFLTFRPLNLLSLNLHREFFTKGSYLFVEDDNVSSGNMASDGISVVFSPIEGLNLVSTIPLDYNFFSASEYEDGEEKDLYFNIGFGAEYSFSDFFTLGTTVKDIFNPEHIDFGVYFGVTPIDNMSIYCGYSYNGEGIRAVIGNNIFNASIAYECEEFAIGADFVSSEESYYTALGFSYVLTDTVSLGMNITLDGIYDSNDVADGEKYVLSFNPNAKFSVDEKNEIGIETSLNFSDDGFVELSVPVYWCYSF